MKSLLKFVMEYSKYNIGDIVIIEKQYNDRVKISIGKVISISKSNTNYSITVSEHISNILYYIDKYGNSKSNVHIYTNEQSISLIKLSIIQGEGKFNGTRISSIKNISNLLDEYYRIFQKSIRRVL